MPMWSKLVQLCAEDTARANPCSKVRASGVSAAGYDTPGNHAVGSTANDMAGARLRKTGAASGSRPVSAAGASSLAWPAGVQTNDKA